jgi:dipeptidyl aminopeptidase/acylaminoacyl peptidase
MRTSPGITLAFVALLASGVANAQPSVQSPALYFNHPKYTDVQLSPSGERIAAITPVKGRQGLAVMDLADRKPRIAAVPDGYDIVSFTWVNDRRLVFFIADRQAPVGAGRGVALYAVDHDGGSATELVFKRGVYVYVRMLSTLDDDSDDILIVAADLAIPSQWKRQYPDVFRLNTRSGDAKLLTEDRPGDPTGWVADRAGVVRAAVSTEKSAKYIVWWRASADSKWQKLYEHAFDRAGIVPVAFDGDGSLIVASTVGRDSAALYRYDTQKMALGEMLAGHPYASLSTLVYDRNKKKVVGVLYDDGTPRAAWFDDDWARLSATVDKALPDASNVLSRGRAQRVLVKSSSDVDPGSWYLLDLDNRKMEFLLASRPDVRPSQMPKRQLIRYKARDGLEIPAYLTLPRDREPHKLPMVLLVHGGPYVRGTRWTWGDEPAYLANLGYAVLQPEFRGSVGWGGKLFRAGWKQWGLAMQDDLVDGIDSLAAQGTIDPARVCIMGASYGGYATMMGLARDAGRYRCGINMAGVTDIGMMFTAAWSDLAYSDFMNHGPAHAMIGDPDRDA